MAFANEPNWATAGDYGGQKSTHIPEMFDRYKALGVNAIQLNLQGQYIEPVEGSGNYDPEYLTMIDEVVEWCGARGIYVILDLHEWRPNSSIPMGFWTDADKQNDFQNLLMFLVDRYKDNPTVCGIHPINVPNWNDTYKSWDHLGLWDYKHAIESLIDTLSTINPNLLYFISGASQYWDYWWEIGHSAPREQIPFIERPNVIFAPHLHISEQMANGDWPWIPLYLEGNLAEAKTAMFTGYDSEVQQRAKWFGMGTIPQCCIEWSAGGIQGKIDPPYLEQYIRDFIEFMQTRHISWLYWDLMIGEEYGLYTPTLETREPWGTILRNALPTPVSPRIIVSGLAGASVMGAVTYAVSRNPALSLLMAALGGLGTAALTRGSPSPAPEGFRCEVCGALLEVPEGSSLGKELDCPRCDSVYETTVL